MEIHYRTKKLERSLTTVKGLSKAYGRLARKINQRIHQLKSADNLSVIAQLPALRLHSHLGKNKGVWSIDIQENWRILFKIEQDPIPTLEDGGVDIKKVNTIRIESITDPH